MSNLDEEIMIPPDSKRLRHDDGENENEDRLSDLHDCILLHILSFLNAEHAVRTCILSTRWKYLWKRLPTLILHCRDFTTLRLKIFTKFVSRVLSLRDDSVSLDALYFSRHGSTGLPLLKKIVNYAISHDVKRLGLSVRCEIEQLSSTIFSCQSLTHLKLSIYSNDRLDEETLFPKSLNLPALISLSLRNFAFCGNNDVADPFLTFNKLNSLVLSDFRVRDTQTLRISSSTLVHLSMGSCFSNFLMKIELCTPSLSKFVFSGIPKMKFYGSNLSSVKQVDIDAKLYSNCVDTPLILFNWLLAFVGIKSLVLTASTLQVLSFIPDLLKARLPLLENLKSLKVKNQELSYVLCIQLRDAKLRKAKSRKEAAKLKKELKANFTRSPPLPDGIVDFLLQNSPSTKVDICHSSDTSLWESVDIFRDY